ncbi:hypothetical protein [Pseudidiomarina salilacus]|uniref:hypothetical protein n=1 Tax=Pseudidiomarina salilacus TaxID=3384452 RepID=UPI003984F7C4
MKKLNQALVCSALLLSLSAAAQERQTVIFEGGAVDDYEVFFYYPNAATYNVVIEFDPTATLLSDNGTSKAYSNAMTSFDVQILDSNGNVLEGPSIAWDLDTMGPNNVPNIAFTSDANGDRFSYSVYNSFSNTYVNHWGGFSGPQGSLFADFSGFPVFVEGSSDATVDYTHLYTSSSLTYTHFDVYGPLLSISYSVADADGDGFADDVDACSVSLMDESVMFGGWLDSGVTNHVDASGCTVMDHYAACQPAEQEETSRFSRFQPRYSGPSYCEKQVSYELNGDGVIDYTEARMLRDALYMSYRSQPK